MSHVNLARFSGHALLWSGFLAGAFLAVRDLAPSEAQKWQAINWYWFTAALAIGALGVVMLRITARSRTSQPHRRDADLTTLTASLDRLTAHLTQLNASASQLRVRDFHARIDAELADDLRRFAEVREVMIDQFGLTTYAEVMTRFASGERNVNRAWSASADGYREEALRCLGEAEQQFLAARQSIQQATESSAS